MYKLLILGIVLIFTSCSDGSGAPPESKPNAPQYKVVTFPKDISSNCRKGIAKIYDECGDQNLILRDALKQAALENKSVLVVYGAEWCIWCHVFDNYVQGKSRKFNYAFEYQGELQQWDMEEKENKKAEREAYLLNEYTANNFVIAHIEGEFSPNGMDAMKSTGFDVSEIKYLPFIVVLDVNGKYINHMKPFDAFKGLEIRKDSGEEYRGFDRVILLDILKNLRSQAIKNN